MLRLRGEAKAIDVARLGYDMNKIEALACRSCETQCNCNLGNPTRAKIGCAVQVAHVFPPHCSVRSAWAPSLSSQRPASHISCEHCHTRYCVRKAIGVSK
eukprot:6389439-Amphidinium_carterae.2